MKVPDEIEEEILRHQQGEESRSAAVRRVLRWGLDRATPSRDRRPVRLAATVAGLAYIVGYALAGTEAASIVGGTYLAVTLLWSTWPNLTDALTRP